jgi:two-component system, cell cycle sensor histidine kinase and response regulator CckA
MSRTSMPRGTETILLVEDDAGVRELVRAFLTRCGYTVLEADGVVQAVALFDRHEADIRLLVTDVVMPQMNGRLLAERFVARQPSLRVLFVSGYTDDQVLTTASRTATRFLQKPFTPQILARTVRQLLDGMEADT